EFGNRGTVLLDPEDIILGGPESNTSLENSEGDIVLQADNDITINENIERDSSVQLQAGRNININANINTSSGNQDINLFGNNGEINSANRSDGVASINQLDGTTLNAGNGAINIQLGNLGEVGDINLANLTTTGQVLVNANGGNIARVSENSLIIAGNGLFLTKGSGGIGLESQPLRLNVDFLEAVAGNSGVFFNLGSNTVNIGGVSEEVNGISTIAGGDIVLKSTNNVNATEDIFADVADVALGGNIEIEANNLNITNGAQISASTFGSGDAGKVDIKVTDTIIFDGVSSDGFASGAIIGVGEGAAGNVGNINIETNSLRVTNGAQISVITLGDGNVGGIDITANNAVFGGVSTNGVSGAFSIVGAEAEGDAAGLSITTSSLEVTNGAQISSNTLGQGTAGNISIQADSSLIISEDSQISTLTENTADGGNIIIVSPENIDFQGDGEIIVSSSGSGNPGNIITTIDPIPNQEIPGIPPNTSSQNNLPPISRDLLQKITTPSVRDRIPEIITQQLLPLALNTKYNINTLTVGTNVKLTSILEQNLNNEYSYYFGENLSKQLLNQKSLREVLKDLANKTGTESAIVYVKVYPEHLQLKLYTKNENEPIIKIISPVKRKELMKVLLKFRAYITSPAHRRSNSYLTPAQTLYDLLITPISKELEAANIKTLLFSMDKGLRTLPIAALHDGKQFLIEKYSLGLIPSFSLIDTRYRKYELQNTQVLAMGASQFIKQNPLPSVPIELETISEQLWQGSQFINEDFTKSNLLAQRQNYPYPIIHLATHAEFRPGKASNSYIQLWGSEQIKLDEMRKLGWNKPTVELLVLSACRTAVGDKNAELGFAGLAIGSGVKSVLASIWYVSDEATLGLMTEFYVHLNNVKVKAEALRQAQLAMLRGEVVITEGNLIISRGNMVVELPPNLRNLGNLKFSHPYYWSGFTMIGSPW
ncbi:MAG: CHAT domain-containing protein, partial [Trichodesmium sp. MAG_R04]|nr:CHAT domain-containing protein [Trichodesmium sp. MAG_R04]